MRTLTILAAGNVRRDDFAALLTHFESVAQAELAIPPDDALENHKAEVNRAIDACAPGWILVLREGEAIDDTLAPEIAAAASDAPVAWGFRIKSVRIYSGKPLRLGEESDGELRLFHRRHCRFDLRSDARDLKVEGPVMRLRAAIQRATYASPSAHDAALRQTLVPHSTLRHLLVFSRSAIVTGAWRARWTTLRYLWIEARYDHGERTETRPLQRIG